MLKGELDLDPYHGHAGIASDDVAAGAFGVELARRLLGKAAHAHEVVLVAAQLPWLAVWNVSFGRPGQELCPSVWTSDETHVEPLTALSPRRQVLVDAPFRPSKVFEGHRLAMLDV